MKKASFLLAAPLVLAACSPAPMSQTPTINNQAETMVEETMDQAQPTAPATTIVDVAASNPDFSTLVAALQAANLDSVLAGPGPFTVFAPTNAAFEKLPAGTVEALLEDIDQLTQVLTYHVVDGQVLSSQVVNLDSATTLQGGSVDISTRGNSVMINDATVVTADIQTSNGVIHVIDTVLLPQ